MAKSYKDYKKVFIGDSDIATLIVAGMKPNEGVTADTLCFGADGSYYAYIVDSEAEIPSHYKLEKAFVTWVRFYDDNTMTKEFSASKIGNPIRIYTAGDFGCIVQIF